MEIVFLTNREFIESLGPVDSNIAGKWLRSALTQAQEIDLKNIIGSNLLSSLKYRVKEKAVTGPYYELLQKIQYYLAYLTLVNLTVMVNHKIANAGVVRTGDDNMTPANWNELVAVKDYYQHKADFFCMEVQKYLLHNRNQFPELDDCTCEALRAHLRSAASSGLWLGGVRDKYLRGRCC